MFSITTARDFLGKAKEDADALALDIANASKAMNAFMSAYHLHEWVWARWLKAASPRSLNGTMIRRDVDFVSWLDANCPFFKLVQELANGSKHCFPVKCGSTDRIEGFGVGPYGIGPFGVPYLLIDLGEGFAGADRYLVASDVIKDVVAFWDGFFAANAIP
jgi:hypothetical protein